MEELILTTPTARVMKAGPDAPRALRVYPQSPCSVHLQVRAIRGEKTALYAGVDLSKDEVARLRDYLDEVLRQHFGKVHEVAGKIGRRVRS